MSSTQRDSIQVMVHHVGEVLQHNNLYFGHGTDNAWDEAVWLVAAALGHSPQVPLPDHDVDSQQRSNILELLERRLQSRKPLAYLLNSAWFCGLEFFVDERVIIPRSPLAELILQQFEPWLLKSPERILDLCTGSACIAIACAHTFPDVLVSAADISDPALAVAHKNVANYQLQSRISLHKSDVFTGLPADKFDLILSNPPYVDANDMAALPDEYRHEPELALAAGDDGLQIVHRILREAADWLTPSGVLICEVGNSQVALMEAYPSMPFTWLEFASGGQGVFLLNAEDLTQLSHFESPTRG